MSVKTIADGLVALGEKIQYLFDAGKQTEKERFWKNLWEKCDTVFWGAFAGGQWSVDNFKPIYPDEKVYVLGQYAASYMFYYFNRPKAFNTPLVDLAEFCERVDFSGATRGDYVFYNARAKNIYVDFSNCTNLSYTFAGGNGGELEDLTIKTSEKCTVYANCFLTQSSIVRLMFTEDSVIGANIAFAQSSLLSVESVDSIINALQDRAGQSALKITFHTNIVNRLTDGQVSAIVAKGWTIG